jgi:D-aminoacyl-tRNA deacylase
MRAVVQRVTKAAVSVDGQTIASIGSGLLVLLGVAQEDGEAEAIYLARKISGLRIFENDVGKMNLGLSEIGGEVLAVSQFTLCADMRKGRRPSFTHAAPPDRAQPLYERFCEELAEEGIRVAKGIFQAHMSVTLVNDGPVTLWLDTQELMSR